MDFILTTREKEVVEESIQEAIAAFVAEMNKKAQQLQMTNSHFVNAHGLAVAQQVSTARDLVKLGVHACGYEKLVNAWGEKAYQFTIAGSNAREIKLRTTVADTALDKYYEVLGGKTGTLITAPFATKNLLTIVRTQNEQQFIGVILGATYNRFAATKELYDIASLRVQGKAVDGLQVIAQYAAVALTTQAASCELNLLYSQLPDSQTSPASITKIMSVMIALDYISNMDEQVTIVKSDITNGSGPKFKAGDVLTYQDLIYAMLLSSSNTAATAMARLIGNKILKMHNK